MRLLPERVPELNPNLRWFITTRLRIIKEVVLDPPGLRDRRTHHGRGVETHGPGRGAAGSEG